MRPHPNDATAGTRPASALNRPLKRANISQPARRYLLSESGGHCQNPVCRRDLHTIVDGDVVAERAHIIPASADGPRGDDEPHLDEIARADAANILLLCPTCHTMIDRAPDDFPVARLRSWKRISQDARAAAFGTPTFDNRVKARAYLARLLDSNDEIFRAYGPIEDSYDEDRAWMWKDLVKRNIIPNNARIVAFLQANSRLLKADELTLASQFELHAQQLADRHLNGNWAAATLRFPDGFDRMLVDAP